MQAALGLQAGYRRSLLQQPLDVNAIWFGASRGSPTDYQALARRLPPAGIVKVTVFVSQPSAEATGGGSAGSIEMPTAFITQLVEDDIDQPLEHSSSILRANQVTDTSATVAMTGPTQDSAALLASVLFAATLTRLVVGWLFQLRSDLNELSGGAAWAL